MSSGKDEKRGYLRDTYFRFTLILTAGLVLRILLSQFLKYKTDFTAWTDWGSQISSTGFGKFYDRHSCDYMPGYLYVLMFSLYLIAYIIVLSSFVVNTAKYENTFNALSPGTR